MFSVLQCTNHFCNEFFGFVIPSSIFFWLMCVTVPVFVILLFTCLFFIFLKSFYCLNFWTFNSRTFYSGLYSSADYTQNVFRVKSSGGAFAKSIGILLGGTGRSYTHRSVHWYHNYFHPRNNCFKCVRPRDINILFQKPKWRLLLK